jgi:UDP-N-acetylmuramoylalanine--D-glutamate ligase
MKTLETRACSLILFGAGAEELANLAKAAGYPGELLQCQELETAVNLAAVAVQRQGASALLLSPACASFDQYRDFEARGEHFRALVQPLLDAA